MNTPVFISKQDALWLLTDNHDEGSVFDTYIDRQNDSLYTCADVIWRGDWYTLRYYLDHEEGKVVFPSFEEGKGVRLV